MYGDALRSAAAFEVHRWERLITDELLRLLDRQEDVVLDRLQGTKIGTHTPHWEPAMVRPLEVKAIIDPTPRVKDAAGSLQPLVRRLLLAVYDRVRYQLGRQLPSGG